jgi:VanZ family protein
LSPAPSPNSSEGSAPPPTRAESLARWVPVVLWATCISWFSTAAFSAQSTNSYIDPVLRYFFGELSAETFRFAHTIIRKTAHFFEYAVLGALLCRALTPSGTRPSRRIVVRAIVYCAIYACLDEAHQYFVPKRTGSPYDSMLDTLGAAVGTLLFRVRRRSARGDAEAIARAPAEISAPFRG